MSTDLEFLHDMSKTRLLTIKTRTTSTPPSNHDDNNNNNVETRKKIDEVDDNNECCRTPTSKEHRIPKILDCPPAPRKPKMVPSCKRKLSELQFFEIVNRDEVDSFFRSSFEQLAVITSAKRNCCPCKWNKTKLQGWKFYTTICFYFYFFFFIYNL